MRVDLDVDGNDLSALPRFQRAPVHARQLLMLWLPLGALAVTLLLATRFIAALGPGSLWRPVLVSNGAALLILAASLQSARWIASWRSRASGTHIATLSERWRAIALTDAVETPPRSRRFKRLWLRWISRALSAGATAFERIGIELIQAIWLCALAVLACMSVVNAWDWKLTSTPPGQVAYVTGGIVLLFAFCLLVLERWFVATPREEWPEATHLALAVRVVIATMLLCALALFIGAVGNAWAPRLALASGLLAALVAAEIALRAGLSLFVRANANLEPSLLAESALAGLLRWPPRPLQTLQDELRHRFGIDLRQNWAFSFMRRAYLPVLSLVALAGWLCSGIREIPIDGRGVYERFGRPVEVLGPGLHAGLPWPLSRLRAVENGTIHELATTLTSDEPKEIDASTVEGPAPPSANRLWDASHVSEKSQVIASSNGDRQSFQVVYMDVRFIYRIALTPDAAMAVIYNSADVPTLIRSTASRVLVRDFATRTLDSVLGEHRTALAQDIGKAVQADLNALDSGVEILATLIEAIHPPAGAANAYHSVQAAQIKAQATIARERGRAAEQVNEARLQASMAENKATAVARESHASAEVVRLRFAAERDAHRRAGNAFLLEQYLSQLGQGLANSQLVILDHRIDASQAPTFDLRMYTPPNDAALTSAAGS